MKKIIFWTALISVVAFFIGACAKRDDTTTTATTVTCDRTASGSITIGSDTVSSSYLMYTGSTPVTGCIAMTNTAWPTGTQSIKQQRIITSSTSFVDYVGYFSDTACTSSISYMYNKYSSLSVGDQVTGLSTFSGSRPSSAYRVTYKSDCATAKGETDAGTELLNYYYLNTGVYLTTGTEMTFSTKTNQSTYNIWAAGNSGNSFYNGSSGTAYPSDWATNDTTYVK